MTTVNATQSPIAKISLVCIWIETVLYGINLIMYGLCMFILLRGGKVVSVRWVLIFMSTILFFLSTTHVGASLRQLLEAFADVPVDVSNYSTMYWLDSTNRLVVLKHYLYDTLVLAQYSILIWRLYVVFMCDWRVTVLPIVLVLGCASTLYAVTALSALPNVDLYNSVVSSLIKSAWVLDLILNVSVTVAIAARLWWMGRKVAVPSTSRIDQYASAAYVIIESGSIILVINILILALYTTNSPATLSILDVASQLAVFTPFLIVVQVGLTGRYRIPRTSDGDCSNTVLIAQEEMVFRVSPEQQDLGRDVPLRAYTTLSYS